MSERQLRVGLVTEPSGIENSYIRGAYLGLERAVRELGIRGRVLTPAPKEGFVPSLSLLARQKYDLVIGHFFAAPAIDRVATGFPETRFDHRRRTMIWRIAQRTWWASCSGKNKPVIWPVTWLRSR